MAITIQEAIELAKEARGNWERFESFGWGAAPQDAEEWAIFYVENRDSDILTLSNAEAISKIMEPFCGSSEDGDDCQRESHGHWACGWIEGYAIRCLTSDGQPTPAWMAWCEIQASLADYPILDEDGFYRMEQEKADSVWRDCYNDRRRVEYIRAHRDQFVFSSLASMLACARGRYFAGYASELLSEVQGPRSGS